MSAAGAVGAAVMISRVLGLIRETVQARYFGAGLQTDAFNVAFRIPNLLRDLFAEGVLSAAFVPTFIARLTHEGREQAWTLANRVINALLAILAIVTLAFFFGAKGFVYLLAAGYAENPEKLELTIQMTRIMSPFLLFVSLASVAMGVLNACGSFFVPALASSAFNVCCILAGVFLSPAMTLWGLHPIVSMAIGALVGGAAQLLVMIPAAFRKGFRYRLDIDLSDPGLRRIFRMMIPAVVGLSATQINITVDSQLASMYGDGPVSYLNYGFRLMQFPIGVFGIAIATSALAAVSHASARGEVGRVQSTVDSSLRLAACLTFPATVGLVVFRREIVQILFERGSFTATDTDKTSQVVLLYALGLFSYSAVKILAPAYYALDDNRTPVRVSFVTMGVKILLNLALVVPLQFLGLALATTIASWVNCGLLIKRLRRTTGSPAPTGQMSAYIRIALASCCMGMLALTAFHGSSLVVAGAGLISKTLRLGIGVGVGVGVFFPLLRMMKVEEGVLILSKAALVLGRLR